MRDGLHGLSEVVVPRMEYRVLRVAEINWLEIGTNERQIANFSGSEIGFLANANAPRGAVGLSLCELGPSLLVLLYVLRTVHGRRACGPILCLAVGWRRSDWDTGPIPVWTMPMFAVGNLTLGNYQKLPQNYQKLLKLM